LRTQGRKVSFLGQHGGLNEQEMLVPFAIAKLSSLKKEKTARRKFSSFSSQSIEK
jgi:hypothetical protein